MPSHSSLSGRQRLQRPRPKSLPLSQAPQLLSRWTVTLKFTVTVTAYRETGLFDLSKLIVKRNLASEESHTGLIDTTGSKVRILHIFLHFFGIFMRGMSCPSWQWHRTGSSWSPVRTLPVAPLWCDLGFFPNSRGNKAAANLRPMHIFMHIF